MPIQSSLAIMPPTSVLIAVSPILAEELLHRLEVARGETKGAYLTVSDKDVAKCLEKVRELDWAPFRNGVAIPRAIKSREASSAVVLQRRGMVAPRCSRCERLGPFVECIVAPEYRGHSMHRGACANCMFYHHGTYCSHRNAFVAEGGTAWTPNDTKYVAHPLLSKLSNAECRREVIAVGGLQKALEMEGNDGLDFTRGNPEPYKPRPSKPRRRSKAQKAKTEKTEKKVPAIVVTEPRPPVTPAPRTQARKRTRTLAPWLATSMPSLQFHDTIPEPMDPLSFCGGTVSDDYWDYQLARTNPAAPYANPYGNASSSASGNDEGRSQAPDFWHLHMDGL
ncbi:hypothetical protein BO71DRAFT_428736 [Aspergillus ellipticus CBS 707.79]|uniref:Uncharacterized protein n=1 Tax=Aspergillus ellipticus CBS 707.79 TaxID=1448320 RepID=A0A319DES8_9EURO|nr:hypothetical protein BO71DRAFT_428736 [Aspergillus ellipticus CBS 707.79]